MEQATPTPEELVRWLVKLLDVKPGEEGHYAGRRKRGGVGRVFGGQVIAQALAAAGGSGAAGDTASGAERTSLKHKKARHVRAGSALKMARLSACGRGA